MAEPVTLARPYAKAAFEVAFADAQLGKWQEMLSTLGAIVSDLKMAQILSSPSMTAEQQAQLLLDVCGEGLSEKVKNFVRVLSGYKRLALLPEIASQFSDLKSRQEKTMEVAITSAFPIGDDVTKQISAALGKKWQCNIELETKVDPALLGGAVIRAGDNVIDASVRGRILKLAEVLGV